MGSYHFIDEKFSFELILDVEMFKTTQLMTKIIELITPNTEQKILELIIHNLLLLVDIYNKQVFLVLDNFFWLRRFKMLDRLFLYRLSFFDFSGIFHTS